MFITAEYLHYGTIALAVSINALGVGIGEGLIGISALRAMGKQPQARNDIQTVSILGMAIVETSAIIALAVAFFPYVFLTSGNGVSK